MERVLGIGGVFFKARDPQALAAWYREHLGVPLGAGQTYATFTSSGAAEPTVWSVFPADTDYFGGGSAPFMFNYRVRDLGAMLAQLHAAGAHNPMNKIASIGILSLGHVQPGGGTECLRRCSTRKLRSRFAPMVRFYAVEVYRTRRSGTTRSAVVEGTPSWANPNKRPKDRGLALWGFCLARDAVQCLPCVCAPLPHSLLSFSR